MSRICLKAAFWAPKPKATIVDKTASESVEFGSHFPSLSMSKEMQEVYLQDSETGHATDETGVLGHNHQFTAVQTEAQEQRLTAGQKLRVVHDAGTMELNADALGQQIQRLRRNNSVLKLVNVDEGDRRVVEQLKHIHGEHFEFVMRQDTAADLSHKEAEGADVESDAVERAAA